MSNAAKKKSKFTHVVVLMYSEDCHSDTYGLTLDHEVGKHYYVIIIS